LTAMTLALEEQRQRAEDTLTLLAAAEAARDDLATRLAGALARAEEGQGEAATLADALAAAELELDRAQSALTAQTGEMTELEEQLALALSRLESAEASAAARLAELEARIAAAEAEAETATAEASDVTGELTALEAQLAQALAARQSVDAALAEALSDAEAREVLLAQANRELETAEAASADSARQVALLNQQVAALRSQLGSLEALLDVADERDSEAQVQINALGSRLNTALAQLASEERARAALEAAEAERLAAEAQELERYRSEFFGRLRELLEGREGVRIEGDRFVFSSEVLFEVGSADLATEGLAQIERVAELLLDVADEIPSEIDWIIRVDGHTDDQQLREGAEFANNWELSQARALSVVLYMSEELGIPPSRLAATGFGEHRPIAPNDTEEGQAANRRIELKLTER
ncbi:peptidoglycan -binding protein, partial [Rhodobacterales bacterium HKCCE4037]|nr:peptidoglycan -binding protein [Rhodobacterales bacterium HKCCE4037]